MNLTLLNKIRCSRTFISEAEILKIISSDLTSIPVNTLKEIARILSIPNNLKKNELITEITVALHFLEKEPLKFSNLKQEAEMKGITSNWFSYRDLKVLLKYEHIEDSGIVYFHNIDDDPVIRILTLTDVGSYIRLRRLNEHHFLNDWLLHDISKIKEPITYRLLFSHLVQVNYRNKHHKLIYTNNANEIGKIFLDTVPGSPARKRLLKQYDDVLLNTFIRSQRLEPDQDPMNSIAINETLNDVVHHYISDGDKLGKALHETKEDTLERFTAIYLLTTDIEDYCRLKQIPDQRPHKIRDYRIEELSELSIPVLYSLCVKEGIYTDVTQINNNNKEDLIDMLTISYISPTFFTVSHIINTDQTTTCLLTPLTEVNPKHLYAYGIRDGTGKYSYYERDELKAKFSSERNFIDPITNKPFDIRSILRLLVISKNDDTEGIDEFRSEIKNIARFQHNVSHEERSLIYIFSSCDNIKEVLVKLFECGLYMRKWNGEMNYFPLSRDETEIVMDEIEIFGRVTESLNVLEEKINNLPENHKTIIWNLKIKNYSNQGFVSSRDEIDGYTLQDRFNIVKRGNDINAPITSCIRLTSGWFLFTALYYHQLLYKSCIYGIRAHQIDHIS